MAKYANWMTHRGKRILFVNVAGLNEAEYIAGLEEMKQELPRDRTAPLVLIDLTKTAWTPATVEKAKEVAGAIKKVGGVWAQCHCGSDQAPEVSGGLVCQAGVLCGHHRASQGLAG